jgi:hypothetical protein
MLNQTVVSPSGWLPRWQPTLGSVLACLALLSVSSLPLTAQQAELGPAPKDPYATSQPKELGVLWRFADQNSWYDTSSRETVRTTYLAAIAGTNDTPIGWTGSINGCVAGTTSQAYRDAVIARVNWFRSMAGVPGTVALDPALNSKAQQAALMMSANRTLSHFPPSYWSCYTIEGAEAAGKSNLCWISGISSDPGCVSLYMVDHGASNTPVGHRRWILYPWTTTMGTGDVAQTGDGVAPSGYPFTNALWVVPTTAGQPRPATRNEFVAWPPPGYVPYETVYPRWSFSLSGADFTNATVTMSRGGVPVLVVPEQLSQGYGENTLVWVADGMDANQRTNWPQPAQDTTLRVSISNVLVAGVPRNFVYDVIIFNPETAPSAVPVTVTTSPAGLQVIVDGVTHTAPFNANWVPGSQHTIAVTSPQGDASTRYVFSNWSDGGAQSHGIIVPSQSSVYAANFTTQHRLTLSAAPSPGGAIQANPASASGFYNAGAFVSLTAQPAPGYLFSNWSGALTGSTNPASLVMSGPRNVTANFLFTSLPFPKTALGVYRGGFWLVDRNANGIWDGPPNESAFALGWPGAIPFTGDWNGDGRTKAGVYANGFWFLDYDGNGVWDGGVIDKLVAWGWDGATPFVGDWNGDGRTKIGVFNKGFWFLDYDGNYSWDGVKLFPYGWDGATPLVGDWNGDGKTDVGVYNLGFWFLDYNGDYLWDNGVLDKIVAWGWQGSTPITGDWNGDGRTKIGTYAGGYWYPDYEGSYQWNYPGTGKIWVVGWAGATPVIGDWSGDGKSKPGAFFNGYWYLDYNGNGVFESIAAGDRIYAFGQAGDTPVVGRW